MITEKNPNIENSRADLMRGFEAALDLQQGAIGTGYMMSLFMATENPLSSREVLTILLNDSRISRFGHSIILKLNEIQSMGCEIRPEDLDNLEMYALNPGVYSKSEGLLQRINDFRQQLENTEV